MKDKLVLITGGSSGIGKAAAKELVKAGARVILQARNMEKLTLAAKEVDPSGKQVSFYSTDLSNEKSVQEAAQQMIDQEGLPDVIVNSAGAGEWLSFDESDILHYRATMDSPYIATAITCKVFYDLMKERGSGHFIIINSAACYFSFPGATGYGPARWALLGFGKALQADLYASNFKVSMVVFGKVDSPYFKNNPVSEERIPKIATWLTPTLSVEQSGSIVLEVVKKKKKTIIRPRMMSFFVFLNRFFPGIFSWLMRMTSSK